MITVVTAVDLLHKEEMHFNRHQVALVFSLLLLLAACGRVSTEHSVPDRPAHHVNGGFRNTDADFQRPSSLTRWRFMARRLWASYTSPRAFEAPRVANDGKALQAGLINPSITWVGHATLLVQMNGINVLTDPQWSERASPVS